jgi:hypothetical protein
MSEREEPEAREDDEKDAVTQEEQGPDASELHEDPAYEPPDPNLKGIKGG